MSSLDSAINSLSAATLEDVYKKLSRRALSARDEMRLSRLLTLLWGAVCIGFAFQVGSIAPTILEGINKIGSAFYGPVFAVFLLGLVNRRVRPAGAIAGLALGVSLNLGLWLFVPSVSWLWWNAFGFLLAAAVMLLHGTRAADGGVAPEKAPVFEWAAEKKIWKRMYLLLGIYAAGIVLLLTLLPTILG